MELLQLLSRSKKPLSLKELSAQCGYPKSTVFGLLTTMRTYDVVTQTPDGKYSLGLRLFEYGRQVERSWDISLVARPYMEHLCQQTGASVVLSVCEGGSVITLDQAETRGGLHIVSDVGSRLPLYCTSQGKVFLANMSRAGAEALLRAQPMTQFTPHTVTDPSALPRERLRHRKRRVQNRPALRLRAGLHRGGQGGLRRGRDRYVPQPAFRGIPRRRGAGLRHGFHDLDRIGLSKAGGNAMSYTASVITVSDLGSRGLRQDTSGPAVRAMLEDAGFTVVHTAIVPDEREQISALLRACADERKIDLILTTGGTGLSPRDVTPEATADVLEREIRAIPVAMWVEGLKITPNAMLSRAVAGTRGSSLIVNLPGSEKAARENLTAVLGALEHALHMIAAEGHG